MARTTSYRSFTPFLRRHASTTPGKLLNDLETAVHLCRGLCTCAEDGADSLFGLAVKPGADVVYFVGDDANTLNLLS